MEGTKAMKTSVLQEEYNYLCNELGDPSRYFPSFRSKNLLDNKDCERIRSKVTSSDKTELLLDTVIRREGPYGEHPLDILISELKKQKVQVHIARRLQRTLKRKIKESGGDGFQRQQSQSSQSTDSLDDSPTKPIKKPISDTGPTPPTPSDSQYEINPDVGPIPNPPPPLSSLPTATSNNDHYHPGYGVGPSTPPPTSAPIIQTNFPDSYPSANGHSDVDSEPAGQSTGGWTTNSSLISDQYSTGPYSYQSQPDLEREKLQATVRDLRDQFRCEMGRMKEELDLTKQELAFFKQENIKLCALLQNNGIIVNRPSTLYPSGPQQVDQQYIDQRYLRQPSPGRSDTHNSLSSQGDTLSIRSATSSTSVNSNPSLPSMQRTNVQSYV